MYFAVLEKTQSTRFRVRAFALLLISVLALVATVAAGPTFEVVAEFGNPPSGPGETGPLILAADGFYWGTTPRGGAYDLGTIYRMKPDGSEWEIVLSLGDPQNRPEFPPEISGLADDGLGGFWGVTATGGKANEGTLFRVDVATRAFTTVAEFARNSAPARGASPRASLTSDGGGNLWGSTSAGGAFGYGTIFKVNVRSGIVTTVIDFVGAGTRVNRGSMPTARLYFDGAAGSGFLWGSTYAGGADNRGTVFKLNVASGELTTVVDFTDNGAANKGAYPQYELIPDESGLLWGTTGKGGILPQFSTDSCGTVFKLNRATGSLTTVILFTGNGATNKGMGPTRLVNDGRGSVWGSTGSSGVNEFGGFFKVEIATGQLTPVFTGPFSTDANSIFGIFLGSSANSLLFSAGDTILAVDPADGTYKPVVKFAGFSSDQRGYRPRAGLTSVGGVLWGTTAEGGTEKSGTIFRLEPSSGACEIAHDFAYGAPSYYRPASSGAELTVDDSGNLVGTTEGGGKGSGTIFRFNPDTRTFTTLANFPNSESFPRTKSRLVKGASGEYWGITEGGGRYGGGTLFKVNTQLGAFTQVYEFGGETPQSPRWPTGVLLPSSAGHFLMTTGSGGKNDFGTITEVDQATGTLTKRADFPFQLGPVTAMRPMGGLVRDDAGQLWGTTGGYNGSAIFRFDEVSGSVTVIGSPGAQITADGGPAARLMSDGRGSLWGTTTGGGTAGGGTIFRIVTATNEILNVFNFDEAAPKGPTGVRPGTAELVVHSDGNIYGTTSYGGRRGGGTIYRLRFGPTPITGAASEVTNEDARLAALINPNGQGVTEVQFEYGTTPDLTNSMLLTAGQIPNGTSVVEIAGTVAGLQPGNTYYYRTVARNAGSDVTQRGAIQSFRTLDSATFVITGEATDAGTSSANIHATVSPGGQSVAARFRYGTDQALAVDASATTGSTAFAGSARSPLAVPLSGLKPHTKYFFRAEADTGTGIIAGLVKSFTTGNTAPVAANGSVNCGTGNTESITLPFDLTDPDGDPVLVTGVTAGTGLTLVSVAGRQAMIRVAPSFLGNTTLGYTIADGFGGVASRTIAVKVVDDDAPTFTGVVPVIVREAEGPEGTTVNFTLPQAHDNLAVNTVTAAPASGSKFPLGANTVRVIARDFAGNEGTVDFVVTVVDTTRPQISAPPGGISGTLLKAAGLSTFASVPDFRGQITATDAVGIETIVQSPEPGVSLPLGSHQFTIAARDGAGNDARVTFAVEVRAGAVIVGEEFASGALLPGAGVEGSGIPAGATWERFGFPSINGAGQIAFSATYRLSGAAHVSGVFLRDGDALTLLAKSGDPAPGAGAARFASFKDPLLNEDGRIAFVAKISGPDVTAGTNEGIWSNALSANGADITLVARRGGAVPTLPDAKWASFASVVLSSGDISVTGSLARGGAKEKVGPENDGILCSYRSAGTEVLLREGQAIAPGGTPGEVRTFKALAEVAGSSGHRRLPQLGGVYALAYLHDRRTCLLGNVGRERMEQLAWSGQTVKDPAEAIPGTLLAPGIAADASGSPWGVIYKGSIKSSFGFRKYAVLSANDQSVLFSQGTPVAGLDQTSIGSFPGEPVASSASVVTAAVLKGPKVSKATDNALVSFASGTVTILAREGDPAAGTEDGAFSSFVSLALPNGQSGSIFIAKLRALRSSSPVTARNDLGLWAFDSTGTLQLLLRDGMSLNGRAVASFSAFPSVPGSPAQCRSYNDHGEIVTRVIFKDGGETIMRLYVP